MFRRLVMTGAILASLLLSSPVAFAQTSQTATGGRLAGVVDDAAGAPLGGVHVGLSGQASLNTTTGTDGTFAFDDVRPGIYRLDLTRAGFTPTQSDVTIAAGGTTTSDFRLQQASLSSLQTIGRVSSSSGARASINTTTAAVNTVSGATFTDQAQLGVIHTLNEIPGLVMGFGGNQGNEAINSASPLGAGIPSLRGTLPYETESLIDGHPINIGLTGTFNPAFISPYVLQDVEVVKGTGSFPTNIFSAVGGTVNYRTLEPTRKQEESADIGVDQFGGQNLNVRATGSLLDGRLGYAFDVVSFGTMGPERGDPQILPAYGPTFNVNGQPICLNPAAPCVLGATFPPSNVAGNILFQSTLFECCPNIDNESSGRNELGKLRYNFSSSSSLTVTYLGGQQRGAGEGAGGYTLPLAVFTPPAGYTGAIPAGTIAAYDIFGNDTTGVNANMYSADFRTSLGPVTLNARYYNASNVSFSTPNSNTAYTGALYGGAPLGNDAFQTVFNGQTGTIFGTLFGPSAGSLEVDKLQGYTLQATVPVANNVFSLSYDTYGAKSSQVSYGPPVTEGIPDGSKQQFQTITALGQFQLTRRLSATLADYATLYTDHYSQDFGATFQDSTHAYNAPRLAFSLRPSSDVSLRASAGFTLTPPYLGLLTNTTPVGVTETSFSVTANSGDIKPETGFGFDFGGDVRIARDTVVSVDAYRTTLHDQFLTATFLSPTPFHCTSILICTLGPGDYPLFITKTENLGHSRYEGIELSVHRDPQAGFGYRVQGALMRAYPYDIPPGFYDTAAGPFTTNLGVLPNVNFQSTGYSFNAISTIGGRVPYVQGYGELNWHGRNGALGLIGVTYFGNNNGYNMPPFGLVNASFREPIGKHMSLQLATTNLTNVYPALFGNFIGGLSTPLVNGQQGWTIGHTVGPSTTSLSLHVDL
jgi:TonB dependent receptor/Carboxypeptidase regulatory-like domain/TonB-dependent Receptor Plug Domain